jgi:phosphoribosylformylglycinamidine synthase
MCIKGNKGIKLNKSKNLINDFEYYFAEDQGRFLIEIEPKDLKEVTKLLDKNSVYHEKLGVIIDKDMIINDKTKVTIDELKSYYTNWLNNYMSS